eukprot:TRINITY_DN69477_c0_g1_i1.p1 TRINITY_DN69477_c0_g1~~TRINITY_DN69477_c0_g1_i1.p1  ORF type:complete len:167 (-),score=23.32 TRINITY_DN69477_c0_g1_i1:84-584(-)
MTRPKTGAWHTHSRHRTGRCACGSPLSILPSSGQLWCHSCWFHHCAAMVVQPWPLGGLPWPMAPELGWVPGPATHMQRVSQAQANLDTFSDSSNNDDLSHPDVLPNGALAEDADAEEDNSHDAEPVALADEDGWGEEALSLCEEPFLEEWEMVEPESPCMLFVERS